MKPAYAIYLLESAWTWDHHNTEIATITVEGTEGHRYRPEFECLLDPNTPREQKDRIISDLKDIAKTQNQCAMDSTPNLVRLYRVTDYEGILRVEPKKIETPRLSLSLKLICEFDDKGNPRLSRTCLRELAENQKFPAPGKFRALTMIDSCSYQIGEDTNSPEKAMELCQLVARAPDQLFQIYDDQGRKYI